EGYSLLSVNNPLPMLWVWGVYTMLIDLSGKEVHDYSGVWAGKMLPGGAVLGLGHHSLGRLDFASLNQQAWDGTLEWTFYEWEYYVGKVGWASRSHHDFQREGNPVGYYAPGQDFVIEGNTLVLAHADELRPEISRRRLQDDIIYEIDWTGASVFEWHAADHIDEFGFDEAALAEIYSLGGDWLHSNSVSWLGENHWYEDTDDARFHPKNIILCSRNAGFIIIIDYQTGEVVWRVGPDYSEGMPGADVGPLIGLHHSHMIPKGLCGEGNILLFDNGGSSGYGGTGGKYTRDYSRVVEFDPTSFEIIWEYSPANGDRLDFSSVISGVQRLPCGNTLITSGVRGQVLEVTAERQIVWEYISPYGVLFNQVYRSYRIPPEWLPENPAGYVPWESCTVYCGVANAEASSYGSNSLLVSGVFNELVLLVFPVGAVIFLRIIRRKI
ncbi:MAG: aryl-sulfate sulfotransferase, partial [Candidatus Zixiibacteriota bacterium]